VLVLCADIGEGHVTVARTLAEALATRADVATVELRTDLDVLGPRLGGFLTRGFRTHLEDIGWTYDLAYRVFAELSLPRRFGEWALAVLGGPGLRRTIAAFGADVVVAEYPVLSAALGELRARGRLDVPVCSSISDPAGLHYWAHPGIDVHLLSWAESRAEVDRIAGPGRAVAVRPLVDPRFLTLPSRAEALGRLDGGALAELAGPLVAVSGGGWGLGDLRGAASEVLRSRADAQLICLAGRNASLEASLRSELAGEPRARVLGFTDQMPELLAAADALVHTTGGTTALEARITGCPLINFGRSVAHVRAHAQALAALDLAEYAPDLPSLGPALGRTLARGRREPLEVDSLPEAAEVVVGQVR
jgi:processive 1,2-diacylglycerol beta-glucosyltransferase